MAIDFTARWVESGGGALAVAKIESERALQKLEAEWRTLERSSGNFLPFLTFDWVSCWWRQLRQDRASLRDSLAIRTVRSSDGRLVGVAPLMLTQRPAVGPFRARCLQFIGADPNMTEVRGALCEPEFEAECYVALRDDLEQSCREVDWVQWSGIDERHGGREAFRDIPVRWAPQVVCYLLPLPSTWEELRASRPHNLKESLRKCYNSLKRDKLAYALEVQSAPSDVAAVLDDFFRLHAARARLDGTVKHNDVFANAAGRAFLHDVCVRFAERGSFRAFRLIVGGKLAATRIGFVLGDCLYLYYSGFDPAYAKYSVMTTTVAEAIKYAIDAGLRSVNLSTGEDVSKLRWRPSEIAFHEAIFFSPGSFGRAKYEFINIAKRATSQTIARGAMGRLLVRNGAPPVSPWQAS